MTVESARHQWDEGVRRVDAAAPDEPRYRELTDLVDTVVDELRRRVGQTFTLAELADVYERADEWVREVVASDLALASAGREAPRRRRAGISDTALVQDAAFGLYARGATDYHP
ncbi:MAG TPA: hypothetical protein VHF67_14325 [Gaiellaceae bacterium]|nr:hypothetical protein [Gaiellaceae bacterium]